MQWVGQLITSAARPFQLWIVVAPWEAALRIRLGKVAAELGPGIHVRVPFVDRIYRQSLRLRAISDSGLTMTTRDGRPLTVAVVVEYGIENLSRLYMELANPETMLIGRVGGLVGQRVASLRADELTSISLALWVTAQVPAQEWGMNRLRVNVTNFVFARTYRVMTNDYRTLTGLDKAMGEEK